jgi:hypothetical protein
MLTININEDSLESCVRNLARTHGKSVNDIVMGALASQMGFHHIMHKLDMTGCSEEEEENISVGMVQIPAMA